MLRRYLNTDGMNCRKIPMANKTTWS